MFTRYPSLELFGSFFRNCSAPSPYCVFSVSSRFSSGFPVRWFIASASSTASVVFPDPCPPSIVITAGMLSCMFVSAPLRNLYILSGVLNGVLFSFVSVVGYMFGLFVGSGLYFNVLLLVFSYCFPRCLLCRILLWCLLLLFLCCIVVRLCSARRVLFVLRFLILCLVVFLCSCCMFLFFLFLWLLLSCFCILLLVLVVLLGILLIFLGLLGCFLFLVLCILCICLVVLVCVLVC